MHALEKTNTISYVEISSDSAHSGSQENCSRRRSECTEYLGSEAGRSVPNLWWTFNAKRGLLRSMCQGSITVKPIGSGKDRTGCRTITCSRCASHRHTKK